MNQKEWNKQIGWALETWQFKEDKSQVHPVLKLHEEVGELWGAYADSLYKPNKGMDLFDDELGDNTFYIRILAFNQSELKPPVENVSYFKTLVEEENDYRQNLQLELLNYRLIESIQKYEAVVKMIGKEFVEGSSMRVTQYGLDSLYCALVEVSIFANGTAWGDLVEKNYKRLTSSENNNGWK